MWKVIISFPNLAFVLNIYIYGFLLQATKIVCYMILHYFINIFFLLSFKFVFIILFQLLFY